MKYSIESDLIWENYMSPREGGLPMQADMSTGGGPFNTPGMLSNAPSEDCEQMDKLQHGEHQEIKMAMADLLAIKKQVETMMQHLQSMETIPGWVQSKITIANQYITDASQFMDYESEDCECNASQASVIKMIAVG
jgi:hypothetical protein